MCNCFTWCRLPEMFTQGGKYPPSDHHPDCEDYKLEKFTRVEFDDSYCIMEPAEAIAMVKEECGEEDGAYRLIEIEMTRDQFNKLPEFEGY